MDKLLGADGTLRQLEDYVKNHGGTVIFSRGRAFGEDTQAISNPSSGRPSTDRACAPPGGARRAGARALPRHRRRRATANDSLPQLIAARAVAEKKPLAATLASAQPADGGDAMPGILHRRFGEGQVLSVGVDGLWRWAFNAKDRRARIRSSTAFGTR